MKVICEKQLCTACSACLTVCPRQCITMERSEEGFDYPEIDQTQCIDCKLCQRVCPVLHRPRCEETIKPAVYAAWSLDKKIRCSSSSGGLFTEFAKSVLERDGVVAGASFTEDMKLKHTLIDRIENLEKLKGSKYLQSDIGTIYREITTELKRGREVFFTGVPCQVAGLYSYLQGKRYENLITADLVCHGIPSPGLFETYIQKLQAKTGNTIRDFSFRKLDGWDIIPSIRESATQRKLSGNENVFVRAFLKGYLHRECCYHCPYATIPRMGDITLADFWGVGTKIPFHHETDQGVSLLLINSLKGEFALNRIKTQLFLEERTLAEAIEHNDQLIAPDIRPKERSSIYHDFERLSWDRIEKQYGLKRTFGQKVKTKIRVIFKKLSFIK